MNCPICNKELKIVIENHIREDVSEAIGICSSGGYDGIWFIEYDQTQKIREEYDLKRYFHG